MVINILLIQTPHSYESLPHADKVKGELYGGGGAVGALVLPLANISSLYPPPSLSLSQLTGHVKGSRQG